ncbi:MAG: thiolase family protein [Bdellovibrionales bacterium]|nr:thiolase family protein [Bdellovibrionales bacterium]
MKTAYLVSGTRPPFAKAGTDLKTVSAVELGRFAMSELLASSGLGMEELGKVIDEVIVGNVNGPSDAANISRVIALRVGLPQHISAYSVHRNCASAMEAISQAALKVEAGVADVIVAGGTESMTHLPLIYNRNAVAFFERLMRAKTMQDRIKVLAGLPIKEFLKPRIAIEEGLTDPVVGINMGQTAEILAKEFKITREEQDQFAFESHRRAVAAQESGYFKGEVATFPVPPKFEKTLMNDSGPRKQQTMEALAKLKPYFDRKYGTVTVGNACPITDGAAMTFVCSEEGLKKLGNPTPLAKITAHSFAGLEPERMGLGPVYASHKALERAKLKLSDMGVVEINEAFAAQVIGCLRAFDSDEFCRTKLGRSAKMGAIDPANLNPNGGAIAIGHPVGATGARIVLTAAREMNRRKAAHALATLCIGGGQGGSVVLSAV